MSENIRVFSVVGRFLEHSRVYRFENDGQPEVYFGSADWMKRNLDRRVATIAPLTDPALIADIDKILAVYEADNITAWDLRSDGRYVRRHPAEGEPPRPSQECFQSLRECHGPD